MKYCKKCQNVYTAFFFFMSLYTMSFDQGFQTHPIKWNGGRCGIHEVKTNDIKTFFQR